MGVLFEFVNEQSSGTSGAPAAANDWAAAVKGFANAPLVSASLASSMPASFWDNVPNADTLNLHAYQFDGADATATLKATAGVVVHRSADFRDSAAWVNHLLTTVGPTGTYGMGRPVIVGEGCVATTASGDAWYPAIYTSSATAAKHWHKWAWAHASAGGGYLLGEWHPEQTLYRTSAPVYDQRPVLKTFWDWIGAVPINNGLYVDVAASAPTGLRAFGQKDLTNKRAHIWVDNSEDTLGNLIDGVTPTARSGDVTFAMPAGDYTVTPYATDGSGAGTPFSATSAGTLVLPVTGLSTDIAFLIEPAGASATATRGSFVVDGLGTNNFVLDGLGGGLMTADAGSFVVDGLGTNNFVLDGLGAGGTPTIVGSGGSGRRRRGRFGFAVLARIGF